MSAVEVRELAEIPEDPWAFLASLDRPTLFPVAGRDRSRTRVVSGLVHGNEPSGLHAVHALLRAFAAGERPAVDALLFIGAVEAAKMQPPDRMMSGRRDLNRCFRAPFDGTDGAIAREALEAFHARRPEAVIDLHNNTGRNPIYAVGVSVDAGRLGLASIFASRFVHSTIRLGALMEAFDDDTAVVTIECGRAFDAEADARAIRGAAKFLSLETLPLVSSSGFEVLVNPVRVEVARDVSFAFGEHPAAGVDLTIDREVDRHNFQLLDAGTHIGWSNVPTPFATRRSDGAEVALFEVANGQVLTRTPLVPVMMTTREQAVRQDCLFYACSRL